MDKYMKINRSKNTYYIVVLLLFFCMLIFNFFTPYLVDDYGYMFSGETGERVQTLKDIAISMKAHSQKTNGRIVAHSLEQFFLLFPKPIFNICNAFVFVWLIVSIYQVCNYGKERNAFLLVSIAMAYWVFIPAYGQVTLWQDGALNYLWALSFAMLFLKPYCELYYSKSSNYCVWSKKYWEKIAFLLLAFLFGMYSENASLTGILMAIGILFVSGREKRRCNKYLFFSLLSAMIGFITLIMMPSEMQNKAGGLFSIYQLFLNLSNLTFILEKHFFIPSVVWAILMVMALHQKLPPKKLVLSAGFFLGALAANYVLVVASYAAERSLCTTGVFMIIACFVLIPELNLTQENMFCHALLCLLTVQFIFSFITGSLDIAETYHRSLIRQEQVMEQKAEGKQDIYLNYIYCQTKYSPVYDLKDLDLEDPNSWPNGSMAKYYGVEHIYGVGENPYI